MTRKKISEMTADEYYDYVTSEKKGKKGVFTGLAIGASITVIATGIAISKLVPAKRAVNNSKAPTRNEVTLDQTESTTEVQYPEVTPETYGYNNNVFSNEESNQIVYQLASNGTVVELDSNEIHATLNEQARVANSSIFAVSQYINDRDLSGEPEYYNFEKLFIPDSADYNAVMLFSNMRNDIISEVFKNNNASEAKNKIESFYNLFTEFVIVGGPYKFTYNNQEYTINFEDLSDMAKTTILEIGTAMFTIDLDYSYNQDGYKFDKEEILNNSVSMLEEELIPRLINKGYRK